MHKMRISKEIIDFGKSPSRPT